MPDTLKHTVNDRMIFLIEYLQKNGSIKYRQDFLNVINLKKQNYRKIQLQEAYFTVEHIRLACEHFEINANWIFGTEKKIHR